MYLCSVRIEGYYLEEKKRVEFAGMGCFSVVDFILQLYFHIVVVFFLPLYYYFSTDIGVCVCMRCRVHAIEMYL